MPDLQAIKKEIIKRAAKARPREGLWVDGIIAPMLDIVQGVYEYFGPEWEEESPTEQRRDELREKSPLLKDAWALFSANKHRFSYEEKQEIYTELKSVQGKLDEAWKHLKDVERDEWRERKKRHINRWTQEIEERDRKIARLEEVIEDNRDRLDNASTDEFAETVQGWIDEQEEIVRHHRRKISDLKEKIASVRRELREA